MTKRRKYHLDRRIKSILDADDKTAKDDELLNDGEVADWFGVSPAWVVARRYDGHGPAFTEFGWRRGECRHWLKSRLRMIEAA